MVKEGDTLEITRKEELANKVLFYKNDAETKIGTPFLEDVLVDLEKLEDKKDDKVVVARFKSKSRYRRKKGHRQPISVVKVKSIGLVIVKDTPVIGRDESPAKSGTKKPTKSRVSSATPRNNDKQPRNDEGRKEK